MTRARNGGANAGGRRKAVPEKRASRRPPRERAAAPAERDVTPAPAPPSPESTAPTAPTPAGPPRPRWSITPRQVAWVVAVLTSVACLIVLRWVDGAPLSSQAAAAILGVLFAVGLSVRSGGRPVPAGILALVLGASAIATQFEPLLAACAVGVGVAAAALAVLGTTPAPTFVRTCGETLIALAVATGGAFAVAGFGVRIEPDRYDYVVLGLGLAASVGLVYRLGAGLHGLGRRGYAVAGLALLLLAGALAYTAALRQWGSPGLNAQVDTVRLWTETHLGAVPHLIEGLVGIPALAWGAFMRARRRQGWWVSAFGAAATAPSAGRLLSEPALLDAALEMTYDLVLGLVIAFLLIRLELVFAGSRGLRARRHEAAGALRPEPGRLRPLR